jgi:hypothetical protein
MYTKVKKKIKTRMKRIVDIYGKGNEIISWRSFCVGSHLVLNHNYYYMRYYHQNMLQQISMSWIDNENVRQGSKTIFGDDNIHSSLCMVGAKVGNFSLYVNFIFRCDGCNSILKHIMGYNVFLPT